MNLVVVTPPSEEPVSSATAKLQARVDSSTDDALIAVYVTASREKVEELSRRALVTQTLKLVLDEWPSGRTIKLPRPPLASVTSVIWTDQAGVTHTMSSNDYVVNTASEPGVLALKSSANWPSGALRESGGISITYQAGYGGATAVPKKYVVAILLLISHLYENREASVTDALSEIPFGVMWLATSDRGWE